MADEIRVRIKYEGLEQGAQQVDRLKANLDDVSTAQQSAAQSAANLGSSAVAAGNRFGQLGGALGNTATVFAGLNPAMAQSASVLGQVGTASTALTGSLGPLGVALGAVTAAVGVYQIAMERARETNEAVESSIERLRVGFDDLITSMRRASEERSRFARLDRGEGKAEELGARAQMARNRAAELRLRIQNFRGESSPLDTLLDVLQGSRVSSVSRRQDPAIARALDPGTATRDISDLRLRRLVANMRQAERQAERFSGLSQEREGEEFLGAIEAPGREGASRRSRRSRGGGRERFRADGETLDDLSSETESIERANAELERQREEREAATMAELERKREATLEQHEFEMELLQELQDKEKEGFETRRQAEEDALDKAKDAIRQREQAEREFAAEASGAINQIASAYITAFQEAIEGQKSLEDAMLDATKAILRSIGEELVARGIGKILEGIASIPSPTAATMIGGGTAMVAFGVGLGAASAAIPSSQGAEAEEPRQDPDDSDSDESREITVVFGNPVLTAGTQAQLARGMGRALRGDRTIPGSVGG